MGKKEEIIAVITPALEALGFYLEDVTITSAGRRSMLTVIVMGILIYLLTKLRQPPKG